MKILDANLDIALLISGAAALVIGTLIFFGVGIYKVKPKYASIIERVDKFHKVINKGWHYFMPIIYKRAGTYCIAPQQIGVTLENGIKVNVIYQIIDPKTYHYNFIDIQTYLHKINRQNENVTTSLLEEEFKKIGIKFISISKQ